MGIAVLMGAGTAFGDFIFAAAFSTCSWPSHLQLTSVLSDVAVDGALSTSPFSCSDDDDSAVLVLQCDVAEVEVEVDVRLSGILPLSGGDASEIDFRKSR
jgi:hypothetical protein